MSKIINMYIVIVSFSTAGFGAGFYFGARRTENQQNISLCAKGTNTYNDCLVNLKSCELTAGTVEEELQDTRWNLGNCEHQVIEMISQTEKLRHLIYRDNSIEE